MILGIDPGSRTTGYGLICYEKKQLKCGVFGTWPLKGDMPERLNTLQSNLAELVKNVSVEALVLEQSFVHLNASVALKLGQVRGVVMAFSAQHQIPFFEYAARRVKQVVVGTGAADKKQVQHMVMMLLGLKEPPPHDAADALALAITHCHSPEENSAPKTRKKRGNERKLWKSYDSASKR